ncbi:ABC transporter permease [Sinomonas sp. B1-1]|uniref:ABC transporter permease n=1 Tax=Sinomonas sp. B1-1 TaxID=3141454 RepID=UPI003D273552
MTDIPLPPGAPSAGRAHEADHAPSTALAVRALLTADATVLVRSRQVLLLNLVVPIAILFLTNRGRLSTDAGFLIGMALTYGLLSSGIIAYPTTLSRDREAGVFQRLRVTPAPTWAIMGSRLAVQFAADLVMGVVVLIVGSIQHQTVFSAGEYALILAIALLGAAVFLAIGQALVALVRSAGVVNAVARVLYIVLFLTGILGATGLLGDDFRNIAAWTPVGALMDLFGAVGNLAVWSAQNTWQAVALVGYAAIFAGIGIRWFRWEPA